MVRIELIKNEELGRFNPKQAASCKNVMISTTQAGLWVFSPHIDLSYRYGVRISKRCLAPGLFNFFKNEYNDGWWRDPRFNSQEKVILPSCNFKQVIFTTPRVGYFDIHYLGYHRFLELNYNDAEHKLLFSSGEKYAALAFSSFVDDRMLFIVFPSCCAQPNFFTDYQASELEGKIEICMQEAIESTTGVFNAVGIKEWGNEKCKIA